MNALSRVSHPRSEAQVDVFVEAFRPGVVDR